MHLLNFRNYKFLLFFIFLNLLFQTQSLSAQSIGNKIESSDQQQTNTNTPSSSAADSGNKAEHNIFVGIPPFLYIVDNLVDGISSIQTHSLLGEKDNIHVFMPTSKEIKLLKKSELFFTSGLEFEGKLLKKVKPHLSNVVVHSIFEKNADDHDDHDEHGDHDDDHDEHGDHDDDHDEHGDHDDDHDERGDHDDDHDEHGDHDDDHDDHGDHDEHGDHGDHDEHGDHGDYDDHGDNDKKTGVINRMRVFFKTAFSEKKHHHDEHTWVDPLSYVEATDSIHKKLVETYPQWSREINNNHKQLKKDLLSLHAKILDMRKHYGETLAKHPTKSGLNKAENRNKKREKQSLRKGRVDDAVFFSIHSFLNPFAKRYKMREISLEDTTGQMHGKRSSIWTKQLWGSMNRHVEIPVIFTPETLFKSLPFPDQSDVVVDPQSVATLNGNFYIQQPPTDASVEIGNDRNRVSSSNNEQTSYSESRRVKVETKRLLDDGTPAKMRAFLIIPIRYNWPDELLILADALWGHAPN